MTQRATLRKPGSNNAGSRGQKKPPGGASLNTLMFFTATGLSFVCFVAKARHKCTGRQTITQNVKKFARRQQPLAGLPLWLHNKWAVTHYWHVALFRTDQKHFFLKILYMAVSTHLMPSRRSFLTFFFFHAS